jgi:hypothetical protein
MTRTARGDCGRAPGWPRLAQLFLVSRRVLVATVALGAAAIALRVALHWHWDTYGALQLPLVAETAAACVVTVVSGSPFGDVERAAGSRLPWLRLGTVLGLAGTAVAMLAIGVATAHLAGGAGDIVRNTVGLVGTGLICASVLGSGLSWTGPVVVLVIGVYGLYSLWHGPALTTPLIFPARPAGDFGAALCVAALFVIGSCLIIFRGARTEAA